MLFTNTSQNLYQKEYILSVITKHTFSAYMHVVWNETYTGTNIVNLRTLYGEGPFHIMRVREISDKCSCGLTKNDRGHYKDCEGFLLDYFPHPQVLYLKIGEDGEVPFCGIFFQPAPEKKEQENSKRKTRKKRKL